jgi:hypothetical protein
MTKLDALYRAFTKLPQPQKWRFLAMVSLWEGEQRDALYDMAKRVSHEAGFPWTDPRTGITHKPPKRKP